MLPEAVARFFEERSLAPRRLLVAASGGPDSTALLLVLAEWKGRPFPIGAAHVNHHLRGAESDRDEATVGELSRRLGVPLFTLDGTVDPALVRERGLEAAAREARYAALRACREREGFDLIATGHQQNDQAETLLIRLVTGSGPGRLGGIRPVTKDGIVRPLLEVPREAIERYLEGRGIAPRRDRMNRDPRFLRTRIREELIPTLEQFNPRILSSLAETARQARDQQEAIAWLLGEVSAAWIERDETSSRLDLSAIPPIGWIRRALLLREILRLDPAAREVSAADLERLAGALETLRRTSVTRTLEIVREKDRVVLRRPPAAAAPFEIPIEPGRAARLPAGRRFRLERLRVAPASFDQGDPHLQHFQLPPEAPPSEFLVRNRRRGDRIRPLGSEHEKKLNDLLIDRKIPRERRDSIPLLVWNGRIVWVAGVGVSEEFKVSEPWRETWAAAVESEHG
ncbi:MAG TPA: tRNA lysidine(34) synthetase TilS [Thermoanaerobaculia bacterium]|nr:tRNA lysidine(34) synthetase TilS [Thermoanaerobaculia bacterium]